MRPSLPFASAYRPWEMLTPHVAEAMVRGINSLTGGPVTGRPLDFAISTGDNADNTQWNETAVAHRPARRQHDGAARLGQPDKWEGVGGKDDSDTAYWHPDGTPTLGEPDNYRATSTATPPSPACSTGAASRSRPPG